MANRVAKELRWTAKVSRDKERGQFEKHLYKYTDDFGNRKKMGLVIWKDRKPVYVLTTECNTALFGKFIRRGGKGLLYIDRPIYFEEYNRFMGGVDVADMKRLFCESRVHGFSRWSIRVFFYHVDVGTVNEMVLSKKSYKVHTIKKETKNLREFKMECL